MNKETVTLDGNEAVARIAHQTNEVIAIYPITPASPMGEYADAFSSEGYTNIWGDVPKVVELQSEGGAAGAVHGALQAGALSTTFTASQGLLLMLPNMYKIAGELTPTVFHIAARTVATSALSIFCDHSDVMSARTTGFAILASNSVQEVMDMALITQVATLKGRIPFLHFFDGFRTSHEIAKIIDIDEQTIKTMMPNEAIMQVRKRAMNPDHPVLRGTSQNPDVFFQSRESRNRYYDELPAIIDETMTQFAQLTGRHYQAFEYHGCEDAKQIIVLMGSGCETVHETVDHLLNHDEKVGVVKVRLFRPFDSKRFIAALPCSTRSIAVLDRTKEPGADGEPLYQNVVTALTQAQMGDEPPFGALPRVIGGRYGLSSKEFTPAMVKAVFDELRQPKPKNNFTIGIIDDVTHTSLEWNKNFRTDINSQRFNAMFYGLGSDGTVSANKNSIQIIGSCTSLHAQGYFVYDSKKSGAVTVSHLRFGKDPIQSSYLIDDGDAQFVACHQPVFLERYNMLKKAVNGATFLLNSTEDEAHVWDSLPKKMQQQIIEKNITFYVIDGYKIATEAGLGNRINTIMQTCFFAISGVISQKEAIDAIKAFVKKSYGKRGDKVIKMNFDAIDATVAALKKIEIPQNITSEKIAQICFSDKAPEFVRHVTQEIYAERGNLLPVSLLPDDGTYPTATAQWEKRNLALEIPVWDEELCIHCGKCPFVCPHSAIRSKVFDPAVVENAPASFKHVPVKGKEFPEGWHISYQVAPEDCTGCTLCVDICPVKDKKNPGRRAINMAPQPPLREQERDNWDYFLHLPEYHRPSIRPTVMKEAMLLQPLFEFSGACSGCGETPYVRLVSQLFGDRMLIANATGCSSIYGGNLPTTPWAKDENGRGPSWNNSLFEDNAEFGLGMRLAVNAQHQHAINLIMQLQDDIGTELSQSIINAEQITEADIFEQRTRLEQLKQKLAQINNDDANELNEYCDVLVRRSVWSIGGDGWAYDIGFGGLDHILASGEDINILVLDTEVYSNTGGQTSKSTPQGAVAKFSAGGKPTAKKDLAMIAMSYENVYVAQVAYAGKDVQTLRAFIEAESYPGVSIIIAYSPCIAWGNDLKQNHQMQDLALRSGHWPLFRYDPRKLANNENPLQLDSKAPSIAYRDFVSNETRFNMLWRTHADDAEKFLNNSQHEAYSRYHHYKQLSEMDYGDNDEE